MDVEHDGYHAQIGGNSSDWLLQYRLKVECKKKSNGLANEMIRNWRECVFVLLCSFISCDSVCGVHYVQQQLGIEGCAWK